MVDEIRTNIIPFPVKPRTNPDSADLSISSQAKDFFSKMQNLAELASLSYETRKMEEFDKYIYSIFSMGLSTDEQNKIYKSLELYTEELERKPREGKPEFEKVLLLIQNGLSKIKINLEFNDWDETPVLTAEQINKMHQNISPEPLPWAKEILSILTKTKIQEAGRVMMLENLAELYEHHLNMFMLDKKQDPHWDIVQTASFILDIADEEFKQEEKYSSQKQIKDKTKQITLDDLIPTKLVSFKANDQRFISNAGITLRADFKKDFLKWIENNLNEFREFGLGHNVSEVFNQLCISAKKGQELRQAYDL
jgi:hypothetical protein